MHKVTDTHFKGLTHLVSIAIARYIFRSRAFTCKGSLEVTLFLYVRPSANFTKFNFYVKLNYETPHMTIYGAQVDQK